MIPMIVLMGVSGCGKSSVAAEIARQTSTVVIEGDDYHCESNIAKMGRGEPLTDQDRLPWLENLYTIASKARNQQQEECFVSNDSVGGQEGLLSTIATNNSVDQTKIELVVLTCSALKKSYRDIIASGRQESDGHDGSRNTARDERPIFVLLQPSPEVLKQRLDQRVGHFMKSNLLVSQLATLQVPDETERSITIDMSVPLSTASKEILKAVRRMLADAQNE